MADNEETSFDLSKIKIEDHYYVACDCTSDIKREIDAEETIVAKTEPLIVRHLNEDFDHDFTQAPALQHRKADDDLLNVDIKEEYNIPSDYPTIIIEEGQVETAKQTPFIKPDPPNACDDFTPEDFAIGLLLEYKEVKIVVSNKKLECSVCKSCFGEGQTIHLDAGKKPVIMCGDCTLKKRKFPFLRGRQLKNDCSQCDHTYSSAQALKNHFNFVHLKKNDNICTYCDKKFLTKFRMKEHIITVHHNIQRFSCRKCNISFYTNRGLTSHTKTIHEGFRVTCDYCNGKFTGKAYLREHIVKKHTGVQKKGFKCRRCSAVVSSFKQLLKHIKKNHEVKKTFICNDCGSGFTAKDKLKTHILFAHQNLRKYLCKQCNRAYCSKNQVHRHEESFHQKVKRHACSYCYKPFYSRNNMTDHENAIHKKIRRHKCEFCDFKFYKKGTMKTHIRKVHKQ